MKTKDIQQLNHKKVQQIFREMFGDPSLVITEETRQTDISRWDSIGHVTLIMALEEAFEVTFTTEEISSISCVGDIFTILKQKGK
jgi:acyl carrier protein